MTKTSKWRRLCCACGSTDDEQTAERPYDRPQRRADRPKHAGHTWTRRSLLDNEHIDENYQVSLRSMAYQMRVLETPTNIPVSVDDDNDFTSQEMRKLIPRSSAYKRSSSDILNTSSASNSAAADTSTTFPWMDEGFAAPSVRSGTRLGISSVHINAARRMSADLLNVGQSVGANEIRNSDMPSDTNRKTHMSDAITSFFPKNAQLLPGNVDDHNSAFNRVKTVPCTSANSDHAVPSLASVVPRPSVSRTSVSSKDGSYNPGEHFIFRGPTSNVGVQRIDLGHSRNLAEESETDNYPTTSQHHVSNTDIPSGSKFRPSVMDIFPMSGLQDSSLRESENDQDRDIDLRYSSEFTFRKAPAHLIESRMPTPAQSVLHVETNKKSKNERLKPKSAKSKGSDKSGNKNRAESMYGYVPRAVVDVSASYALEGSTIDDFFKMRTNSQEKNCLKRLPYAEDGHFITLSSESETDDWEPDMTRIADDTPYVITAVVEEPDDDRTDARSTEYNVGTVDKKAINGHRKTPPELAINGMLDNLNLQSTPRTTTLSSKGQVLPGKHVTKETLSDVSMNRTSGRINQRNGFVKHSVTDENENKVIMIDFPPNLDNNKRMDTNLSMEKAWPGVTPPATSTVSHTHSELLY